MQLVKEEWDRQVLKASFTSDIQISQELDAITGTSGGQTFSKDLIFQFLRSKGWVIEELQKVKDLKVMEIPVSKLPPSVPLQGPKTHIVYVYQLRRPRKRTCGQSSAEERRPERRISQVRPAAHGVRQLPASEWSCQQRQSAAFAVTMSESTTS